MAYNFTETESAKENSYLNPGIYKAKITEVKLGKTKNKGTEFLGITFTTDGGKITENFMLSEKALPRLQYLHEAWTGKKLNKNFKTATEVEEYFAKVFTNVKAGAKNLVVGGEVNGQNVYAKLPYTAFIADSDAELGEFEQGDADWKKYVKKTAPAAETDGKPNGLLNDTDDDNDAKGDDDGDDDDMPWD